MQRLSCDSERDGPSYVTWSEKEAFELALRNELGVENRQIRSQTHRLRTRWSQDWQRARHLSPEAPPPRRPPPAIHAIAEKG
jgi:hypothetical protein